MQPLQFYLTLPHAAASCVRQRALVYSYTFSLMKILYQLTWASTQQNFILASLALASTVQLHDPSGSIMSVGNKTVLPFVVIPRV